ncbi:hypothetical protein DFH29DRAFT_1065197 [Suillus ampliporus]|nr:hypothetical protein DFH29DRAFT_1065197 [Suillus ampliporus]
MISTIAFNGAAHVTVTGYLMASFFKEAVLDHTSQVIREAEKVTAGLVVSDFLLSTTILFLAANQAARLFLRDGINQKPAPMHDSANRNSPFNGDNIPAPPASSPSSTTATEVFGDSPIAISTPHTLSLASPIQKPNRLSIASDTTLVDHEDVSDDASGTKDREWHGDDSTLLEADFALLGSARPMEALTQTTKPPRLKPPDRKRTANGRPPTPPRHQRTHLGNHKYEPRASRLLAVRDSIAHAHLKHDTAVIGHLEQVYSEMLVDQAALVDGWAAAMAELGLPSMLSPAPSLPHQKMSVSGTSAPAMSDKRRAEIEAKR